MTLNQIFRTDANLLGWSSVFKAKTIADPIAYGLDVQQVNDFNVVQMQFAAIVARIEDVNSRNRNDTIARNTARDALVELSRTLIGVCEAWPSMTNDKRGELNIPIYKTTRTPSTLPAFGPTVTTLLTGPDSVRLTVRDPAEMDKRSKPKGVQGVVVQVCFTPDGEQPTLPLMDWPTNQIAGKTTIDLMWPGMPSGQTVWVSCHWLSTRNERGPSSVPQSVRLLGSSLTARQTVSQDPTMKIAA